MEEEEQRTLTFEDVLAPDLLLPITFLHLYPLPLSKTTFSSLLVNSAWSKVFRHPLQTFIKGDFNSLLSLYPPSYYFIGSKTAKYYSEIISSSLGMTRQLESLAEKVEQEQGVDKQREEFAMREFCFHKFVKSPRIKNGRIRTAVQSALPNQAPDSLVFNPDRIAIARLWEAVDTGTVLRKIKQAYEHDTLSIEMASVLENNKELDVYAMEQGMDVLSRVRTRRMHWRGRAAVSDPEDEARQRAAVKRNGLHLADIHCDWKTPELCMLAVEQNGDALVSVPLALMTEELMWAAVNQNGSAIQFVPKDLRTEEMSLAAVRKDVSGTALGHVNWSFRTEELCHIAVQNNPKALKDVPPEKRTAPLCENALKRNGSVLYHLPQAEKNLELCKIAVDSDGRALAFVPRDIITPELCLLAVQRDGQSLPYAPRAMITQEMCEVAVRHSPLAFHHVPKPFLSREIYESAVRGDKSIVRLLPLAMQDEMLHLISDHIDSVLIPEERLLQQKQQQQLLLQQQFITQ